MWLHFSLAPDKFMNFDEIVFNVFSAKSNIFHGLFLTEIMFCSNITYYGLHYSLIIVIFYNVFFHWMIYTDVHMLQNYIAFSTDLQNLEKRIRYALIVDGSSLSLAIKYHSTPFLELCIQCASVLCCRLSPIQKAQVT